MDMTTHSEPRRVERAVYVEACRDGVNPETVVRIVYIAPDDPDIAETEQQKRFATLAEALAFAQSLCDTESKH